MSIIRESLAELETKFSRRALFHNFIKGAGLVAAYDRYGPRLFAAATPSLPYQVYSAIGDIVIPIDDDPGWASFEPDITTFGVDVYVRNVLLGGNFLAFVGYLNTMAAMNQIPVLSTYGFPFLSMSTTMKNQFFSDILTGKFENDGFGDVAGFSSGLTLLSTKATFFSNFPDHLEYTDINGIPLEFQVRRPKPFKTGWDIMQLRGPVGPQEEAELRARYFNAEELPGVDPSNRYI